MGTRGTIHILDGKKTVASIYRQMDSYPSGLGEEIKSYLKESEVVNGYSGGMDNPKQFNGIGCLAAYLIGKLKLAPYQELKPRSTIGNVYLTNKADRQEYNYFISEVDGKLKIKVTNHANKTIFNDLVSNFNGKKIEGAE